MGAAAFPISDDLPGVDEQPTIGGTGQDLMQVAWQRTYFGESEPRSIKMRELRWDSPTLPANVTIGPERDVVTVPSGHVKNPELSRNDHGWFGLGSDTVRNRIVWQRWWETPTPGDYDCYTASFEIAPSTFLMTWVQSPALVPDAGVIGVDEVEPSIATITTAYDLPAGVRHLVAWEEQNDVYAHMLDDVGPVGSPITVRATASDEGGPAVAAGACEFTVCYGSTITLGALGDIEAARVTWDGDVLWNDFVAKAGGASTRSVQVTSRPNVDGAPDTSRLMLGWLGTDSVGIFGVGVRAMDPTSWFATPWGVACSGSTSYLPSISLVGEPEPGNDQFGLRCTGAPPFTIALLVTSSSFAPVPVPGAPGCVLYTGLPIVAIWPEVTSAAGTAEVNVPLPCSVPPGASLAFQWGFLVETANPIGIILSNDYDVYWY